MLKEEGEDPVHMLKEEGEDLLLQDECRKLSVWLSTRLADYRSVINLITQPRTKTMKYYVTIEATIRKTYEVEADSKEEATEAATEMFSALEDGTPEYYTQEVLGVDAESDGFWNVDDEQEEEIDNTLNGGIFP